MNQPTFKDGYMLGLKHAMRLCTEHKDPHKVKNILKEIVRFQKTLNDMI